MSPFKRWKQYRHINTIDVDIVVIGPIKETEQGTETTVAFWNRHYKKFQGEIESVLIDKAQYDNWEEIEDTLLVSPGE